MTDHLDHERFDQDCAECNEVTDAAAIYYGSQYQRAEALYRESAALARGDIGSSRQGALDNDEMAAIQRVLK